MPAVFAVAAPLWQAATPPETLTRLYAEEPGPAHLGIAFESTLIRLVSALKGGMAHRS